MEKYSLWFVDESILSRIGEWHVLRSKAGTELSCYTGCYGTGRGPQWTKGSIEPDYVGPGHRSDVSVSSIDAAHPYGCASWSR